jgi:hypothetical protein
VDSAILGLGFERCRREGLLRGYRRGPALCAGEGELETLKLMAHLLVRLRIQHNPADLKATAPDRRARGLPSGTLVRR